MAAVLLFFFLISSCATTAATATSTIRSTTTYPEFQELNVKETIAGTKMNIGPPTAAARNVTSSSPTTTASDSGGGGGGKWKVKVVHRDGGYHHNLTGTAAAIPMPTFSMHA
ncbi:protein ASPARTIC PROTEASE IN GUARD CELL 2 [Prunus yedoensis var. nudiflora]|uniref:Protein ASPARTIC PROTEASE IN GUARD CELL 2 n=1 Tax=Prunus yedoensis var. nudiflora TaxID=2094558 RepID=A0A314XVI4_PRUYE|nr:protein ASPARTIC PROTEASE IN GUARD CELL 2 [Prunus yedoensis var. nudiflora]